MRYESVGYDTMDDGWMCNVGTVQTSTVYNPCCISCMALVSFVHLWRGFVLPCPSSMLVWGMQVGLVSSWVPCGSGVGVGVSENEGKNKKKLQKEVDVG